MSTFAIIGSGISGCTAGLELAEAGHRVIILERDSKIGGKVLSFCCKATDECQRCGVCVGQEIIAETIRHENVEVIASCDITGVKKDKKKVSISVILPAVHIVHAKCISCGKCIKACPEHAISRVVSGSVIQYVVNPEKCVRTRGGRCTKCQTVCPASAIKLYSSKSGNTFTVDGVVVAIGHSVFEPARKPIYLYGLLPSVFTAEEAEKILTERKYLVKPGEDVAFIQCVGSRDPEMGLNYCSAVCCGYAVRIANLITYNCSESRVTIYYIDLQNFDKTFATQRQKLIRERVKLSRGIPFDVIPKADGKVMLHVETGEGRQSVEHDAVVLSAGIGPCKEAGRIARLFGLEQDEFGFISSSLPYIYATGTCVRPQSIVDCITSARAVAGEVLARERIKQKPRRYAEVIHSGGLSCSGSVHTIPVSRHVVVVGKGESARAVSEGLKSFGLIPVSVDDLEIMSGHTGAFDVKISGGKTVRCGAIVVADEVQLPAKELFIKYGNRVVLLNELEDYVSKRAKQEKISSVGIILDSEREEPPNSTRRALNTALNIRAKLKCETYVLCHDLRVAGDGLEDLHTRARDAGVIIIKYDGAVQFCSGEDSGSEGVRVNLFDSILQKELKLKFDFAGISPYGIMSAFRAVYGERLKCGVDSAGYLQENNIRYFPEITRRPGVFVVGECRGQHEPGRILDEAKAVSFRIAMLLGAGRMAVSSDTAVVDSQKCALCLTCMRVCPHTAIVIDEEKRSAKVQKEVCLSCGICVSHCPAKAISLSCEKL
jgi:heterodisulfide reductase subunit A-like polyferredoxin